MNNYSWIEVIGGSTLFGAVIAIIVVAVLILIHRK